VLRKFQRAMLEVGRIDPQPGGLMHTWCAGLYRARRPSVRRGPTSRANSEIPAGPCRASARAIERCPSCRAGLGRRVPGRRGLLRFAPNTRTSGRVTRFCYASGCYATRAAVRSSRGTRSAQANDRTRSHRAAWGCG
jgi:hypothetical protein